ncbi:MAG: glycosyl hydrolase family 5 [Comamonadaceae bacterium]|nr:glycosyl hydrolase family 5 [Comamonadaceae bacterium]
MASGGASALKPSLAFWGANWAWAGTTTTFNVTEPYQYSLVGKNTSLDFDMAVGINKVSSQQMAFSFDLTARSARTGIVGGGMVFNFDLVNFGADMGNPTLLPDRRGWAWGTGATRIEMRFDAPLADAYFEMGNPNQVRLFFYKDTITPGKQHYNATLTLTGDAGLGPTTDERFGLAAPSTWPTATFNSQTSPVGLAFLNTADAPAGKRGFVKAVGEQLQFADGSSARFWGTNITAYALYNTPKDAVKQQARRLSELGFNLVRLHHHDSPWVNPNIFGGSSVTNTKTLSADALDKLDWWIKCLKDEGIYIWMDLHVQRALMAGDAIYGFDEIRKGQSTAEPKGYNYVNTTIQSAMRSFNEAYVSHINPYTGAAYKDEPAIAAMLITNENDLTNHYGNALLPDKSVPLHNQLYTAEANQFALANSLPKDQVWRSWVHGPSKLFLNDLERRFNVAMIAQLRALGVKVPVATTSTWGNNPLSSLPALTSGDVVDAHAYGGLGQLEKSPLLTPTLAHWLAAAQVVGKPMTVTEWNAEPFPTPDRHAMPMYIAGTASFQGWAALMQYAYTQESITGAGTASNWHSHNDPSLLATLPAAALMYRQGHVQESSVTYVVDPGDAVLFGQNVSAANSALLRTASEMGKLQIAMPATKELPWLTRTAPASGARVLNNLSASLMAADATSVTSATGETTRNWAQGVYTINTPKTQAGMGWIGGQTITLGDIEIKASTPSATVVVQSLDGAPVASSGNLMISLGTRSVPQSNNKVPFYVEPLIGQLRIRAPTGLTLYKRDASQQLVAVPVSYSNGYYSISLAADLKTNWLFLKR